MSNVQPENVNAPPDLPDPDGFEMHLGWIAGGTVIVCAIVWGIVFWVTSSSDDHGLKNRLSLASMSHGARKDLVPKKSPLFASNQFKTLRGFRNLSVYESRRAYPGAPPVVPHPLVEKSGHVERCLSCHQKGGYVPKYKAYAPVTPHPNFINCVQCHVPQKTKSLFRPVDWKRIKPPKLGFSALPGSPPPVPHSLQMRTNCFACHTGPAAVRRIRTPHPDRLNCLQCHVPQNKTAKPFRSPYAVAVWNQPNSSKRTSTKKK